MSQNKDVVLATLTSVIDQEVELFHDAEIPDRTYGQVTIGDTVEVFPLEGKRFRRWLMDRAREKFKCRFSEDSARTVIKEAAAKAQFRCTGYPLAIRVGQHEGITYLDLADKSRRAVKITPGGPLPWEVVQTCPVKFLRPAGMLALPEPVRGGRVDELRDFLNLDGSKDWTLFISWLLSTLRPAGPYPALFVNGEQGTAKSTTTRTAKMLIDPNKAPIRSAPRTERDLLISTTNSWLLGFDNLSILPDDLSDCICRVSTGGGFSTRSLYTDCDEQIFYATRPVVFNGIEEIVLRSDLLDRMVWVTLPTIPDHRRKTEQEYWRGFHEAWPRLLGAVLEVVSLAERDLEATAVSGLPRMADFARFAIAAEKHLGLSRGSFMEAYDCNRKSADELVIEASSVGTCLRKMMEQTRSFKGTAAELLDNLNATSGKVSVHQTWPSTPRKLSGMLRRITPNLRRLGIEIDFLERTGDARPIEIRNLNAPPSPEQVQAEDDCRYHQLLTEAEAVKAGDGRDGGDGRIHQVETRQHLPAPPNSPPEGLALEPGHDEGPPTSASDREVGQNMAHPDSRSRPRSRKAS